MSETAVTARDSGKKLKLHGTCTTVKYIGHNVIFEENIPIAGVIRLHTGNFTTRATQPAYYLSPNSKSFFYLFADKYVAATKQ